MDVQIAGQGLSSSSPTSINSDAMTTTSTATTTANGPARRSRPAAAKTFQCRGYGDCRMVFSRSEHLARHIRKHTGERPFSCHCGKQFSRLDNLRQHAQTVHAERMQDNEEMMRQLSTLHANMSAANKAGRGKRRTASAPAAASDQDQDPRNTPRDRARAQDTRRAPDTSPDTPSPPGTPLRRRAAIPFATPAIPFVPTQDPLHPGHMHHLHQDITAATATHHPMLRIRTSHSSLHRAASSPALQTASTPFAPSPAHSASASPISSSGLEQAPPAVARPRPVGLALSHLSPRSSPLPSPLPRSGSAAALGHTPHPLSQGHSPEIAYFQYPSPGLPPHPHDQGPHPQRTSLADPLSMEDPSVDDLSWSLEAQSFHHHSTYTTTTNTAAAPTQQGMDAPSWEHHHQAYHPHHTQAAFRASPAASVGSAMESPTTLRFPSNSHPSPPSHPTLGSDLSQAATMMATTPVHAGPAHAEDSTLMSMGQSPAHSLGDSPSWSSSTTGQLPPMAAPTDMGLVEHYYRYATEAHPYAEETGTSGLHPHPYGEEASATSTLHGLSPHPASSWAHQRSPSATSLEGHPRPPAPHRYSQELALHQQQQLQRARQQELDYAPAEHSAEEAALLDMQEMAGVAAYPQGYSTFTLQAPPATRPHPVAGGLHPSLSRAGPPPARALAGTPGALPLPRPYLLASAGTPPALSPPAYAPHSAGLYHPHHPHGPAQGYFELQPAPSPHPPGSAPPALQHHHHHATQAYHMPFAPSPQVALHMGPTPPPLLSQE